MGVWAVAGVALANGLGVKAGGRAQAALTGLKVVLVAALIALLLAAWGHPPPPAPPAAGGGRFSLAFVGILFAVGGWEYAVLASEEVRDPRRTIPRALLLGTALVVALYLLVVLAYLNVLGPDGVAHATALAPQAAAAALPGSEAFVAVAVAVSALGTLNAIMLLGPRATFAAARDGLVPAGAARLAGNGAPVLAILLQAALSCAFLLTGTFQAVAAYTVVGTGLFIVLCAAAVPRLRKRAGVVRRPVHALEDAAAFLVAGVFAWFLVDLAIEAPGTAGIGLALVAAGLVPMAVLRRRWRVPAQA
jgi:amino acid transporter